MDKHKGKKQIWLVIMAAFLVIMLVAAQLKLKTVASFGENVAQATLNPVYRALAWITSPIREISQARTLLKQAENLRSENLLMKSELASLKAIQMENSKMRKLLNLKLPQVSLQLTSRVIGREPNTWFHLIIIDRGQKDGLNENSVALNEEGLIGRVVRLSSHTSQVLLLCDPRCAVPALDAANNSQGVIYGDGMRSCRMKYIDPKARIKPGDLIITSGVGGVYPKGIIIGKVLRVTGGEESIFQEAQVFPAVNFGELELVKAVNY